MVSSGLKDSPYVSQYWLAFHLCMAFILFSLLFLLGLQQYYTNIKIPKLDNFNYKFSIFYLLYFYSGLLGGLVAGLNAGLVIIHFH